MSRYIDLDDDRVVFCGNDGDYERYNIPEDLPSEEPERKKGHWIRVAPRYYKCSECGVRANSSFANFCHRCGSDMRGEKDG